MSFPRTGLFLAFDKKRDSNLEHCSTILTNAFLLYSIGEISLTSMVQQPIGLTSSIASKGDFTGDLIGVKPSVVDKMFEKAIDCDQTILLIAELLKKETLDAKPATNRDRLAMIAMLDAIMDKSVHNARLLRQIVQYQILT